MFIQVFYRVVNDRCRISDIHFPIFYASIFLLIWAYANEADRIETFKLYV